MMEWMLKTRGLQPIGLDIGHSAIKMIQLVINGEHIEILAADKVHVEVGIDGDGQARRNFVVSAIKQMLAGGKFRGRNVVSCLPNDELKITSLRLAETEAGEIEQAVKKEASQRFGLDPNKDMINYLLAGSVQSGETSKNEIVLFAASDEVIRNHIAMLEEAQIRPVAIDTIPYALFRSFERSRRREEDREQTVIFADIGSRFTTVVFGRGGEISFVKQIPIGGKRFNREITSKLGVGVEQAQMLRDRLQMETAIKVGACLGVPKSESLDENGLDSSTHETMVDALSAVAEELAREISLCLRYYTVTFRGRRVERAVFSGGEAYERILLNILKRHLAVEIEVAQPLKGLDIADVNLDNDRRGYCCEWAVAVGLGLKGWEGLQ
jgi:type IV pilus assembly protein PilM